MRRLLMEGTPYAVSYRVDHEATGPGMDVNGDALVVGDPTVISTGPNVTRYVRVEVQNDGSLPDDDGSYIELRSLKLFSVSAPE